MLRSLSLPSLSLVVILACGPDRDSSGGGTSEGTDGAGTEGSDGSTATDSSSGNDGMSGTVSTASDPLRDACELLCDKIVSCTAQKHAQDVYDDEYAPDPVEVICEWIDRDAAYEQCVTECVAASQSPATAACVSCLGNVLVCFTTGPMRPCDAACEGTPLVTGHDFEGAAEYDYWTYFFGDIDDPSLWDCQVS